ncbi:mucin-1 isoform X1 [Pangasianodon hypophthalmus]|uniref:mucin-1 isoform X1 n=1 Tax=Pangasianodon hypophthalmus TaxID=310915 RepID=UPI0023078F4C|nr:mucin-1 isoform X1 [Pangasianodon hypophthalmus]
MAARVTLFVFCYFLFQINVSAASEGSTSSPNSNLPQNFTQAVNATEEPQTSSAPSTSSAVNATEGPQTSSAPSTSSAVNATEEPQASSAPSTSSAVNATEEPQTSSAPSTSSAGTTSAISNTSALSGDSATTTSKTTQSVQTTGSPDARNRSAAPTENNVNKSAKGGNSVPQSEGPTVPKKPDLRYLWFLVLGVAVLALGIYLKFRCFKVQQHPVQTMDHGTENASFQRTESNKDGVMLLGVKSGGEENAAAK